MFKGKKVIVLGERDGVPGPAIAACLEAVGADVIFTATENPSLAPSMNDS